MTVLDAAAATRWAVSDTAVIAGRSLRHWVRQPQLVLLSTVQPVMLVVLFTQVFGGAVDTPGIAYVDFLVPGVIVQVVAWDSAQTAVGLAEDLRTSTIDRFRTLPMAPPAVLAGRTFADAARNLGVVLVMVAVGHLVGFRFSGGIGGAVAAIALVIAFGYAMTWVFALVGLSVGGAEAALAAGFVVVFPMMFASSALVPVSTLPGWLQPFAAHQPITLVVDATRALALGTPATRPVVGALLWTGALLLCLPFAVRRYYRASR